jgi:hypothetical protein
MNSRAMSYTCLLLSVATILNHVSLFCIILTYTRQEIAFVILTKQRVKNCFVLLPSFSGSVSRASVPGQFYV